MQCNEMEWGLYTMKKRKKGEKKMFEICLLADVDVNNEEIRATGKENRNPIINQQQRRRKFNNNFSTYLQPPHIII